MARRSSRCSSLILLDSVVVTPREAPSSIGVAHPRAHRLDPVPELLRDPLDRPVLGPQLRTQARPVPPAPPKDADSPSIAPATRWP